MKIALVGAGNVATHLGYALKKAGHEITDVYSRSFVSALYLNLHLKARYATDMVETLSPADLYIIAVSDHAIKDVLKAFARKNKPVVHTSGSISMKVFGKQFPNAGVLYPVQTFSKERKIDFKKVPLLIEATNKKTESLIKKVANSISSNVVEMNSIDRKAVHLASVISNNFSNHLFILAEKILKEKSVPFSLLGPLLKETVDKALALSPSLAQTGPAKRGDAGIIEEHIKMLSREPRLKQIYQLLTKSIEEESAPLL